ncbi:hypothetical protein K6L09_21120 [Burkholderia cepacia]
MTQEINSTISQLRSALSTAKFHAERLEITIACLKSLSLSKEEELSDIQERLINIARIGAEAYDKNIENNGDEMNNAFYKVYESMDDYLNEE